MPVLPYAKKLFPRPNSKGENDDADSIFAYMQYKDSLLETDTQNRLFGIKNKLGTGFRRIGYRLLRDFYEGDHWLYAKEEGASMNVVNFCRMTVDNYTAFLTQEEPEIDIPPQDVTDDLEVARVSEVEKLIKQILDDNNFYNIFYDCSQNASILGDGMIAGPFYDADKKRIRMWNVKLPEYVRIIWRDEDYTEILGFILHYYLSVEEATSKWGDELSKLGIDVRTLGSAQEPSPVTARPASDRVKRVLIREFWDDQVRLLAVDDRRVEYDVHNFGFVPLEHVKNMPHPYLPWGTSDIEDVVDPNRSYNEISSDMQDILKQIAFPSIFGKNLDVETVQAGIAKIYDFGDEAEVFPDPRKNDFPALQTYIADRKQDIDITSGVPNAFQGGKGVENISGRALSVIMTPINNKIRGKQQRWNIVMQSLVRNIMILLEKHVTDADKLIQHQYKSDFFFPGSLVRDVTDELNKFIQKIQSQYTTMKNIGIASPKDEQTLIKKELSDEQLLIELSKNPQMQMAIAQQMIAQARGSIQAPGNNAGDLQSRRANGPILNSGENQPGDMPASANGNNAPSSASPEGAVAANGSNGGAPTNITQ